MITKEKLVFRTWEVICLEKLAEIGKSSAKKWSEALGMNHPNSLAKVIKRITNSMPERLLITKGSRASYYEVA